MPSPPILRRGPSKLLHPGPYEAVVTSHLDFTQAGMVEAAVTFDIPSSTEKQVYSYPVKYLSPFYGVTGVQFEGNDSTKFDDVQKSYGMWMIPPDIGTKILVIFIDGNTSRGYWIGCVIDDAQNHMIPGIAASKNTALTAEQQKRYKTGFLPVAEAHKKSQTGNQGPAINKRLKPVHPFAERLLEQGLLLDDVRGTTTSSARREIPSYVFGISTPGPLDKNGPKKQLNEESTSVAPVSRLGGTQFVMDDGDIDGQNELVRLRTRTGHQILMHNTKDLIYIGNAKGTSWVELTSNGKIDIYATDCISIHSEQDINFRAERNINFEAAGTVNVSATQNVNIESGENINLLSKNDFVIESANNFSLYSYANMNIRGDNSLKISSLGDFDVYSGAMLKVTSNGNLNLFSNGDILQKSDNFHIRASNEGFITTGGQLHINGAPAKTATGAQDADAEILQPLKRFALPNRSLIGSWDNDFYKITDLMTMLTRIPTHEPYQQHESFNPEQFSAINIDQSAANGPLSQTEGGIEKVVKEIYTFKPNISNTPPLPTKDQEESNLQAFLWTIRFAEGRDNRDGYRTMWSGDTFEVDSKLSPYYNYRNRPTDVYIGPGGIVSSAAGAYQLRVKVWEWCQEQLNLPDFSPASQDKAAIFLLGLTNSLENIKKGNFAQAIYQNRKTWTSLPGSGDTRRSIKTYGQLLNVYKSAGGKVI